MTAQQRTTGLPRHHSNNNEPPTPGRAARDTRATEAVVGAAVLVAAAFRMRDESSLTTALRELATAVAALEQAQAGA